MDYDLHYDAINVALSPCITDCSSSIERRFNSRANQQMLVNKEQGIYKARFKTSAEEYIKKLGLWRKNLIPVSGSDDYRGALYYKKPLNAKGYWFICDESVANPGCKSVFELSPSSHATLYFNIRQLKNHKDIREKITALVQSFVKKD